jgi:ATP-binding cassette subfamily B protein
VVDEIRFENVKFEYRENRPVVRDFSVTVPSGSVVALVGRSGAGKTTVTDLVARFHDPTQGRILLNGTDIRNYRLRTYRGLLALVQEDVFLFDGSVRDNIAYGRHDASDAEVEDAARRANAHEFIVKLPEKYATFIGERGVKLSAGSSNAWPLRGRFSRLRRFLSSMRPRATWTRKASNSFRRRWPRCWRNERHL